jgi:hypothetical protein
MKTPTIHLGIALGLSSCLLAADPPTPPPELPTVRVLATDPSALVGTSSGAFTVVRSGAVTADLVVAFSLGGTAANGVDYREIKPEVTIPAGFWAEDIVIEPLLNPANRGNKTVTLHLLPRENVYGLDGRKVALLRIVDDTFNDVAPKVALTSPADGAAFELPAVVTLTAEASDPDDPIQGVSFFADDICLGRVTTAPYTLSWTNPPVGPHALFARAFDQSGKSAISTPVKITVKATPPAITLTAPTDGQVFPTPATVKIDAQVTKGSGAITKVLLLGDGRPLATLHAEPYTFTWERVPAGPHAITATVIDEFGQTATASVRITVQNQAPTVRLTKPADGDKFPIRTTIDLAADAADPDGTVHRVLFYANDRLLGFATKAPYTLAWKHPAAGVYGLTAVAIDNNGLRTVSSKVTIAVTR